MGAFEEKLQQDMPRGFEGGEDRPAEARWLEGSEFSKDWEFRDAQGRAAGIFLGRWNGELKGRIDDRHVLTVAGSRGGKGESLIKPNLWWYEGSVVVTDPKGELARETAARRRRMGQRVVILDPFDASETDSQMGWNPLEELDLNKQNAIDDALAIAESMVQVADKGETHWAESAQGLIQGLLIATKLLPDGARDLCAMRDLLMLRHDLITQLMKTREFKNPRVALFALMEELGEKFLDAEGPLAEAAALVQGIGISFGAMIDRESESILSTARTQTRFLESSALKRVLTKHSVNLGDIKREPTTLYLCLPAGRMGSHAKWLRIVINMALQAFEEQKTPPPIPVLMLLDEFPVLGHMNSLEVAAGQLAGLGVKLWTVVQDLTQLQRIYKKGWETFVGNAGVVTFFANNDGMTVQYISKNIGSRTMLVAEPSGASPSASYGGALHQHEKLRSEPLMGSAEARNLLDRDTGRLLVLTPKYRPALLQRVIFHKERNLFKD